MAARRVVILDDDLDLVAAMVEALGARGLAVQGFSDAIAALQHMTANPPPDILLLDYLLAEMNGAQFARALAREHVHVPIVLLTGASRVCQDALHHVPAALVIKKPFDLDQLLRRVEEICSARDAQIGLDRTDGPGGSTWVR